MHGQTGLVIGMQGADIDEVMQLTYNIASNWLYSNLLYVIRHEKTGLAYVHKIRLFILLYVRISFTVYGLRNL